MNLIFNELSVFYNDKDHTVSALSNVSFKVKKGEVTALVGESGSGKTTLGLASIGLLPSNATNKGQVWLGTKMINGLREEEINELRLNDISMVFQNGSSNFNPVINIIDQVAEPLISKGKEKKEALKEAEKMLLKMGLKEDLFKRFPHQLSGGQVQRALFAMALILDPEVLILDEPTASLDNITKNFVKNIIREEAKNKRAVLLITHDLALASDIADKTVVIYMGQVMEETEMRISDYAAHPYTHALLRSFPFQDNPRELGGIRGNAYYRYIHHHKEGDEAHNHMMTSKNEDETHTPAKGCIFRPRCTQAISSCSNDIEMMEKNSVKLRCVRGGITDLITIENISKSYGENKALHTLDLGIKRGELFCIIGETGSGKTTLGMITGCGLKSDSGEVIFNSEDLSGRKISDVTGIIYQSPMDSVSHRFNLFDIVAEPLVIKGFDKELIKRKVYKAVKRAQLSTDSNFLSKFPHELNMGAVQRVCIARAIVNEPLFLLADEPTSALDPSVQAKVLKMLLDLQTEMGLTMIFITHNTGLARKIADRAGVMHSGVMVEMGKAKDIFTQPDHPYTKLLVNEESVFESDQKTFEEFCPFLSNCSYAYKICYGKMPDRIRNKAGFILCHRISHIEKRNDNKLRPVKFN